MLADVTSPVVQPSSSPTDTQSGNTEQISRSAGPSENTAEASQQAVQGKSQGDQVQSEVNGTKQPEIPVAAQLQGILLVMLGMSASYVNQKKKSITFIDRGTLIIFYGQPIPTGVILTCRRK